MKENNGSQIITGKYDFARSSTEQENTIKIGGSAARWVPAHTWKHFIWAFIEDYSNLGNISTLPKRTASWNYQNAFNK